MDAIETVKAILSEKVDISNLKEEDSLTSLGLDSLDLVEVMLAIEDKLNIEFTSEEIAQLSTLKDVVKLIERKTK
ncbi:MAG: acyl carrier protein [Bacilli bacterium]|nr:acyl carrier protein [Bacilli bacterium]